jgi:2-succinyl-5-enolpyruvyl-6-hydroxy-3-cyclohexene-1-carboxylate synthase
VTLPRAGAATFLAALTADVLRAGGVAHVVLCPGSRSAPLAYRLAAAARDGGPALHVRHDERVAAFTALGIGLAGGLGAVVTTSGTAAGNLGPAALEAHHGLRPLILITADRPPSLRGTWANQTSELQAAVFGGAVRARVDLADTDALADPSAACAAMLDALDAARGRPDARGRPTTRPGPVHLNLGFSEPLTPSDVDLTQVRRAAPRRAPSPTKGVRHLLAEGPRTVVLAGDSAGPDARAFAETAGLPLLAEPSSGARGGPQAIGPYRLLLELPDLGGRIERVVAFGRPTLSRPVTRLLGRPEVDVVLVSPFADWPDPGRSVTRCTAVGLSTRAPAADDGRAHDVPDDGWAAAWRAAGARAVRAVDAILDADAAVGRLTGPLLARETTDALQPGDVLLAAASNPIRDLDLAAHVPAATTDDASEQARVLSNRGLAGIDGTVSTATGIALARAAGASSPRWTRVLVGDVAFLHDIGALLGEPGSARPDLQIVVLNDDGGGIFSLLEYGELAQARPETGPDFERLFGTPHGADLAALCRGYGVPHLRVTDLTQLRAALAAPPPGTSVLEVPAVRADLRALHARIRSAVHAAITGR